MAHVERDEEESWAVRPLKYIGSILYGESKDHAAQMKHLMQSDASISQPLIILGHALLKVVEEGGVLDSRLLVPLFNTMLEAHTDRKIDDSIELARIFVEIVTKGEHDLVERHHHLLMHSASRGAALSARMKLAGLIEVMLPARDDSALTGEVAAPRTDSIPITATPLHPHAPVTQRAIAEARDELLQAAEERLANFTPTRALPGDERRWAFGTLLNSSLARIAEHGGILNEAVFQMMVSYARQMEREHNPDAVRNLDAIFVYLREQDLIKVPEVSAHGRHYPRT